MAVIGTIRVPNLTPFRRTLVAVTNLPLPQGLVTSTNGQRLTARSAFLGSDVPVQVMAPARRADGSVGASLWPDGSWRIARVAFPVEVPAATIGGFGYPLWTEREIEIVDGGQELPAYTFHPDLDLAQLGLRWGCRIFNSNTQQVDENPWRNVDFTALAGTVHDYLPPYGVSNPPAQEDWDTSQVPLTRGWVHAFTVAGRITPEADGGSEEEPTTYAAFNYEVPNGSLDGCGRIMRAWLECGHSLYTEDSRARYLEGGVNGTLQAAPAFDLRNLDGNHRWLAQLDQSGYFTASQDNSRTDYARVTPLQPFAQPNRNSMYLPFGYCRVMRMQVLAAGDETTLTALDSSTWSAIRHSNGAHACPDAVATSWHDHQESYGPYGVALRWDEIGWSSEDDMRDEVGRKTQAELVDYRTADAYPLDPKHCNRMASAQSSNHPNFCAFGLQSYVASGHPDLRSVWLSMTTEAHRGQTYRDLEGRPMSFRHDLANPGLPSVMWAGVMMFEGIIWRKSNLLGNSWYSGAGKGPDVQVDNRRFSPGGDVRSNGRETGYTSIDAQHCDFGHSYAYAALTGDRWMVGRRISDLINHSFCHKPQSLSDSAWTPVNQSMHGTSVTRSEGRVQRCRAQAAWWTWDDELFDVMASRTRQYTRFNRDGNPDGNFQGTLEKTVAVVSWENGYFAARYDCGSPGQLLWNPDSPQAKQSYSNFQHAMIAEGFYLTWRMLDLHGGYSAAASEANYIFRRLSRGHLLGAWRNMPNGDRLTFYAWDVEGHGFEPIPVEFHGTVRGVCNRFGNPVNTEEYGPPQPDRAPIAGGEGLPRFRMAESDFNPYAVPPAMLAAYFDSSDPDVLAKAREILVDRRVYPSQDDLRSWVCNYFGGYLELCCTVPDPFRRWANLSGSVTYDETASVSLSLGDLGSEVGIYVESAEVDVDPGQEATETVPATYDETATADPGFETDATEVLTLTHDESGSVVLSLGDSASERLDLLFLETGSVVLSLGESASELVQVPTAPLLIDETANADLELVATLGAGQIVFDETATADPQIRQRSYEDVVRTDAEPVDESTITAGIGETIDAAIGRARRRSRRVRLYADSYGDPARVTMPGPWRGSEPTRRSFRPDARVDDA